MDPIIIFFGLLVIGLFIFRWEIINRLRDDFKKFLTSIFNDIKFTTDVWWKTILIPILIVSVYYIAWILFSFLAFGRFEVNPLSVNIPVYILMSGIFAPVYEEILQCILLNMIFLMIVMVCKNKTMIIGANIAGLLFVAAVFAVTHDNVRFADFFVRFISFIIYGGLFYLNDRNILPAIIAHSAWNLMLLTQMFL